MARFVCMVGFVIATAVLSGCVADSKQEAALAVSFTTNWSPDSFNYFVEGDSALPTDFQVVVTEIDTDVTQTIQRDKITTRSAGTSTASLYRYDVPSGVAVRDGHTYRVEGFVGDEPVGFREIVVKESALDEPAFPVRATYDMSMQMNEHDDGDEIDMGLSGTFTYDQSTERLLMRMTGKGTMALLSDEMEIQLTIRSYEMEEVDEETTRFELIGDGPWTLEDDEGNSGEGTTSMRTVFQGYEEKRDGQGALHRAERSTTDSEMSGTITAYGATMHITSTSIEDEWVRDDTDEPFWHAGSETTTYTYPDGTSETETDTFDEAVDESEEDADLLDVVDFQGMAPRDWQPGDAVEMEGLDGVAVHYTAREGGEKIVLGQSTSVLIVEGSVFNGVSGNEDWTIAMDGPYAGLPTSYEGDFSRGGQSATMNLVLSSAS